MLVSEEYLAPARPGDVLAGFREAATAKGWAIEEEHPDRFFALEQGTSVRLEPRKMAVFVEDHSLETKIRFLVWCSGFTIRRYDGKVDLLPALPFKCTPLSKAGAVAQPVPVGSTGPAAERGRRPSWVWWARFGEFGLLFLSFAAIVFFVMASVYDLPTWAAAVGVVIAAVASLSSGLGLDFFTRRVLKITSMRGMNAQLRRAGLSAAVAVVMLVWLWRM